MVKKVVRAKIKIIKESTEGKEGKVYWYDVLGGQRVAMGDWSEVPREDLMAYCIDYGKMVWNDKAKTIILVQGVVKSNPLSDDSEDPPRGCIKIIPAELIEDIKFMVDE